ncbi:hypothetical protein ET445_16550 [Agromyces protaetiae]|uniref:DUF1624 domain-containing protein n=1 Tax=Agromyces protaetiae TaxID=2509455 RepID=A0A4P6FFN3_9MICO|nr:hypothetical protein [Agromyces protaetiae]QAY74705.1 hypothetical protein ET445_16550 [Agromyces protaetiae]
MTGGDAPATVDPPARAAGRGRVDGVDTARGLALIGMFIAHAAPAATTLVGAELLAIPDERSRLLFALTAGLALGFVSGGTAPIPATGPFGGPERTRLRLQITVRAVILIALGLLIAATLAPLVYIILDEYGVAFLVLLPLLFVPRAVQLVVGAVGVLIAPGLAVLIAATPWVADVQAAGYGLLTEWFFSGPIPSSSGWRSCSSDSGSRGTASPARASSRGRRSRARSQPSSRSRPASSSCASRSCSARRRARMPRCRPPQCRPLLWGSRSRPSATSASAP